MNDKYSLAGERLWEKLEATKDRLDLTCVDFKEPFLWDQFAAKNPIVKELLLEVQDEFDYKLSEFQGSWAVNALIRWQMADYNQANGRDLQPRS